MKARVEVLRGIRELSERAAKELLRAALECDLSRRSFNVALSGGSTPELLYRLLADRSEPFWRLMPWNRIHLFWTDERYVPYGHPQSNFGMVRECLLDRVTVPKDHLHPMPTGDGDPDAAARAYEGVLRRHFSPARGRRPRFDLILLGMGADGHTASLFPGLPAVRERKRWVVPVRAEKLPAQRLTLTLPVLNNASRIIFLVAGKDKALAASKVLGRSRSSLPARRAQPSHGELLWLLDRPAASRLPRLSRRDSR